MSEPMIFGVDIYPHYAKRDNRFGNMRYALVVNEGNAVTKRLKVSRPHLLHLIRSCKPSIIAVDNAFELAPDVDGLRQLFAALPLETKVVQVTGTPGEAVSLQEAAVKHGLEPLSEVSPMDEAELCAKLARLDVGSEVRVLGDETRILVARSVSLGPGGSSQSRYRRKIHVSILDATRRIERALKRAGIDYDLFPEEADFGLERAVFTVYSPRTRLNGIVRPGHGQYIRVKVSPTYRDRIEFVDKGLSPPTLISSSQDRKLIVGVDPGTTCGLAVVTFDGTPLYVTSGKDLARGEILKIVTDLGKPVVVAADVVNAPTFVGKLAKTLDSVVFTPETLMGAVEKQDVAQAYAMRYGLNLKDSHARDAFAAAVKAFQHYRNKFEQVDVEVKRTGVPIPADEVKTLVIKGQPIQRAIQLLTPQKSSDNEPSPPPEKTPSVEEDRINALQKSVFFHKDQVRRLKEINEQLSSRAKSLESQIVALRESLDVERDKSREEIRREREYQVLRREIEKLREQLSRLQRETEETQRPQPLDAYADLAKDEKVLLKPVESFTREGLEKTLQQCGIEKEDILIILDASGGGRSTSKKVAEIGVKAAVACTPMAHQAEEAFKEYGLPILASKDLKVEWVEGRAYVRRSELEAALNAVEARDRRAVEEAIHEIIDEYREERKRPR